MLPAWGKEKNMTTIFLSTALVTAVACATERRLNLFFPPSLGEGFILLDKTEIFKIMETPLKLHRSIDNCQAMATYYKKVKRV